MNKSKDLSTLNREEVKSFLNSFDTVFCDVDGVVRPRIGNIFNGVKETFNKLQNLNKKVRFVTHNNLSGIQNLYKILSDVVPGLVIDDIVTPIAVIIYLLKESSFDKEILYLGCIASKNDLLEAGFKLAYTGPEQTEDDSLNGIVQHLKDNKNIGAVIIDFDPNIHYIKIVKAVNYLRREDVLFLSTTTAKYGKVANKILLGGSYFQHMIEDATGRLATHCGKPSTILKQHLFKKFNVSDASRCLFVGDVLDTDIVFGHKCGFQTLSVGQLKIENGNNSIEQKIYPDFSIDCFGRLHTLM